MQKKYIRRKVLKLNDTTFNKQFDNLMKSASKCLRFLLPNIAHNQNSSTTKD